MECGSIGLSNSLGLLTEISGLLHFGLIVFILVILIIISNVSELVGRVGGIGGLSNLDVVEVISAICRLCCNGLLGHILDGSLNLSFHGCGLINSNNIVLLNELILTNHAGISNSILWIRLNNASSELIDVIWCCLALFG